MRNTPRKIARENGDQFYYGDKPCKRGHIPKRYSVNGTCAACHDLSVIAKRTKKNKELAITRHKHKIDREGGLVSEHETYKEMVKRIYKRGQIW